MKPEQQPGSARMIPNTHCVQNQTTGSVERRGITSKSKSKEQQQSEVEKKHCNKSTEKIALRDYKIIVINLAPSASPIGRLRMLQFRTQ